MIYKCAICDQYKDDDIDLAEFFDDTPVCMDCLENTPEEDLPALLKKQAS